VAAAHFGDVDAGEVAIEPLRDLATPLADTFAATSYVPLQRMFDEGAPWGLPTYVKSDFLTGLDGDAVTRLVEHATVPTSPLNQVLLRRLGGRIADVGAEDTAFGLRSAEHMILIAGTWTDPTIDPVPHVNWVRDTWSALRPWAAGTYVNHLGDEGADRIREAYLPRTWQRLTALKARMDPANVFALNQNIPPHS
jgi:hypothetical protein